MWKHGLLSKNFLASCSPTEIIRQHFVGSVFSHYHPLTLYKARVLTDQTNIPAIDILTDHVERWLMATTVVELLSRGAE
jgi:hypothetical protein